MGHDHHPSQTKGRLFATLAVTLCIMIAEVVGGLWSGSLALLADAGHMLTDVLALLIAFVAVALGGMPADDRRTYGYRRLEVLAALINGVALVVVSGSIVLEAIERWSTPREIDTTIMIVVAAIGLVANLVGLGLLGGHRANLNVRGAFLHILGDTLSSVGVLVAAGLIALTGWARLDAIVSLGIAIVIVVTSLSLLREVIEVLLEAAPRGIDTDAVRRSICATHGVRGVFDLHIWSITSGIPALSAHIVVHDTNVDRDEVLIAISQMLRERFGIGHSTLQIEAEAHEECYCANHNDLTSRAV
jgi:cobalt-zinc-cadmium efflux system protein